MPGYPRNGIGTELDAIAAVVIGGTLLTGGTGYVLGSMIGVFVYGTIKTVDLVHGRRAVLDADHHRRCCCCCSSVVQRVIVVPLGASKR